MSAEQSRCYTCHRLLAVVASEANGIKLCSYCTRQYRDPDKPALVRTKCS